VDGARGFAGFVRSAIERFSFVSSATEPKERFIANHAVSSVEWGQVSKKGGNIDGLLFQLR
jgi:hypothetical protein